MDQDLNLTSRAQSCTALILRDNTYGSGLSPKNLEGLNSDTSIKNYKDDDLINQSGNKQD